MKNKNLLIVFAKNPVLGKCKTRLAKDLGKHKALIVYNYLLQHTANVVSQTLSDVAVFYSDFIEKNDCWDNNYYKKIQTKGHLGIKMKNAFQWAFESKYKKVCIIGTDLLSLETKDLSRSFELLENNDLVFGPAEDGGYYLMGMQHLINEAFLDKAWSTNTVLQQTIEDVQVKKIAFLNKKNDIDTFEDLKKSNFKLSKIGLKNHLDKI